MANSSNLYGGARPLVSPHLLRRGAGRDIDRSFTSTENAFKALEVDPRGPVIDYMTDTTAGLSIASGSFYLNGSGFIGGRGFGSPGQDELVVDPLEGGVLQVQSVYRGGRQRFIVTESSGPGTAVSFAVESSDKGIDYIMTPSDSTDESHVVAEALNQASPIFGKLAITDNLSPVSKFSPSITVLNDDGLTYSEEYSVSVGSNTFTPVSALGYQVTPDHSFGEVGDFKIGLHDDALLVTWATPLAGMLVNNVYNWHITTYGFSFDIPILMVA